MNHFIVIRSAYAPSVPIELNRYRLRLTSATCSLSLACQTDRDCIIEARVHNDDPLLKERLDVFRATGMEVRTERTPGMAVRTRMDDDDFVAVDFVERIHKGIGGEGWFSFPRGIVVRRDEWSHRRLVGNQFITRVSDNGVFEIQHRRVTKPTIIDEEIAWAWVRHGHNRSPDLNLKLDGTLAELPKCFRVCAEAVWGAIQ